MRLDEVAEELYGLVPGEFVAARDARAKELRSSDRELAEQVKALRRPAVAAWAVNQLVRHRDELLGQVLDLGVSLRQAQAGLQGEQLRALTRQRRQLVAAVTTETRALARSLGVRLTDQAARQVEDTLSAALADEDAAAAVRDGMLTEPLESTGLGSLALGNVVGVIKPGSRPAAAARKDDRASEREAAMAALEEASGVLTRAEQRVEETAGAKATTDAKALQLQAELDEVRRRVAELEHALDQAADQQAEADEAHQAALAERDDAKEAAAQAAKVVARLT